MTLFLLDIFDLRGFILLLEDFLFGEEIPYSLPRIGGDLREDCKIDFGGKQDETGTGRFLKNQLVG